MAERPENKQIGRDARTALAKIDSWCRQIHVFDFVPEHTTPFAREHCRCDLTVLAHAGGIGARAPLHLDSTRQSQLGLSSSGRDAGAA